MVELNELKEIGGSLKTLYKNERTDTVWWAHIEGRKGYHIFTFDKKTFFNLFTDYPYKLTPEQKAIFDKENPFWAMFFLGRNIDDKKDKS